MQHITPVTTDSVLDAIHCISSLCKDRHAYLRDVCAYACENVPKLEEDNDAVLNIFFYPFEIASNIVNEQHLFLPLSLKGILFLLQLRRITGKTLYIPPNVPIPAKKKSTFASSDVTAPTQGNSINNGSSPDTRRLVNVIFDTIGRHRHSLIVGVAALVLQCLAEFIHSCECLDKVQLADCFQSAFEAQLTIKPLQEFGDSSTILKEILTTILKKRDKALTTPAPPSTTSIASVPAASSSAAPSLRVSFPAEDATKPEGEDTTDCLKESCDATVVSVPEEAFQFSVDDLSSLGGVNSQPEWLVRYDEEFYEILLRICYLSTRNDAGTVLKSTNLRCRRLSCTLLAHFLNEMDMEFASSALFESALHKNVTLSLLYNCTSEDSDLYCIALDVLYYLIANYAPLLKSKVVVFVLGVLLPLVESNKTSYHQKSTILTFFDFTLRNPQILSDWFTNFDCVQGMTNLCEIFVSRLSKLATMSHVSVGVPVKQDEALRFACSKVLCTFIRSVKSILNGFQMTGYSLSSDENLGQSEVKEKERYESGKVLPNREQEGEIAARVSSILSRESASLIEVKLHDNGKLPDELGAQSRTSVYSARSSYTDIEQLLRGKKTFDAIVKAFNARDYTSALSMAEEYKFLSSQAPEVVAQFLLREELDPVSIGDFLCKENDERKRILSAFIELNDFSGLSIDEAMRLFLSKFKPPGEAQVIDRVMEIFADKYCAQNPESFSAPSPAFILAFSIMILNTDAHSSHITDKMTLEQFIRNNRGIDDGKDIPDHVLEGIYQRITANEILLDRRGNIQPSNPLKTRSSKSEGPHKFSSTLASPTRPTPTTTTETTLAHKNSRMRSRKTEADFLVERLLEEVTLDVSTEPYNSSSSAKVAGALLESTWTALLVAFSVPVEETENMDLIDTCLEGIGHAIKVSCRCSCRTERKAFISALLAFTHLTNLREIEYKSLKSIVVLIRIALEEGDYLETSWYEILHCISLLSKLQILAESSPILPSSRGETPLVGNDTNVDDESNIQSLSGLNKERTKLERQNAETIAKYIDEIEVHRLFSRSNRLKDESVVNFVEALCLVSAEELNEKTPRLFALQKLVEVTDANIGRLRYVWSRMWANISRHFVTAGLNSNQLVSMFIIDHLRQLARIFLVRRELGNFNFQKDVLRLFEDIAFQTKSSALKELIVASLTQMVDLQPESLGSGWSSLLTALGYCVRNETTVEVIHHAAIVLQCITLNHLRLLSPQDLLSLLVTWEAIGRSASADDVCQVAIWFIRFVAIFLIGCDVLNSTEISDVGILLGNLVHQRMSPVVASTTVVGFSNENSHAGGNDIFKKGSNNLLSVEMIKYMTSFFTSALEKNEVERCKITKSTICFSSLAISTLTSLVKHNYVASDAIDAMMSLMSTLRDTLMIDTWWGIFSCTVPSTLSYLLDQYQLHSDLESMRLSLLKQAVMAVVGFSQYNFLIPSVTVDHALFLLRIVFGGMCVGGNASAMEIGFHGGRQILHNFEKYTGVKHEDLWSGVVTYIQEVGDALMGQLESICHHYPPPTLPEKAIAIILGLLHYVKSLRDVALMKGLTLPSRTTAVNTLLDILRRVMLLLRSSFFTTTYTSEEALSYSMDLFITFERSVCNVLIRLDEEYGTILKDHINIFWSLVVEQLAFISPGKCDAHREEAESLRILVRLLLDTMHQLPVELMVPCVKTNMPMFCQLITVNDSRFAAALGSLFLKYHTATNERA